MDGQAKSIRLGVALPLSQEKGKERVGQGVSGRANSPPPACHPYSLCLLQTGRATLRRHRPQLILLFLKPREAWPSSFSNMKTSVRNSEVIVRSHGRMLYTKLCPWFGGTYPMCLWCGNKHIIMATRIPTPVCHCGKQEASLGSNASLPKSNCLVENPFSPLRHLTVWTNVVSFCYKYRW